MWHKLCEFDNNFNDLGTLVKFFDGYTLLIYCTFKIRLSIFQRLDQKWQSWNEWSTSIYVNNIYFKIGVELSPCGLVGGGYRIILPFGFTLYSLFKPELSRSRFGSVLSFLNRFELGWVWLDPWQTGLDQTDYAFTYKGIGSDSFVQVWKLPKEETG